MKQFRTEVNVVPSAAHINLKSGVLTQGSCFSDAIGNRLKDNKLNSLINPFGVIYNPVSIHSALTYSIFNEPIPQHTFLQHGDIHLNYQVHSKFSALSQPELMTELMNTIGSTHYFLKDAGWLLITYGTAWAYNRKDTGEIVANCHKAPAALFTKSLMTEAAITASFKAFYDALKKYNPGIKIIITVSPVRHLKDTLELNSVSKSVLRLACHSIANLYDNVDYFPAYEMMMDDLRDYRFYASDMLHPSEEAEDYIWEKFTQRYLDEDARDFIKKWNVILAALHHRAFHPHSSQHQQFLRDTLGKLEALRSVADVEAEVELIKKQII